MREARCHEIYILEFHFVNRTDKNAFHIHTDICMCTYVSRRIEFTGNNMGIGMEKHSLSTGAMMFGEWGG